MLFSGLVDAPQAAIVVGLGLIFVMLTIASRHLPSVAAAGILAGVAVFIQLAPSSTPTIIAVGCVAGSYLALWIGRSLRLDWQAFQRDRLRLEGKIDAIGSQTTLADIRLAELNLLQEHPNARLVPKGGASEDLPPAMSSGNSDPSQVRTEGTDAGMTR
jgi:hypothetical protein